ncbi:MAG: aminotransferase class IV [Planctomyces sp.]|nr:aminotransferase class IV [Planctomyces sp.]
MTQPLLANWNGVEQPLDEVRVSVLDRGFLFGDGGYEVLRIYGGRLFLLDEHMQRLVRSLDKLRIAADVPRIERRLRETLAHSGVVEGMAYLQVTRGEAPRMHRFPPGNPHPNELIYIAPLAGDPYGDARETGAAVLTTPDVRWGRCDIKSINLLANCLAAQAAAEAGCQEALLVAEDGAIVEGSHTSVFGVKDGAIWTTPLGPHILPGITRGLVLRLAARAGISVVEKSLHTRELGEIDELFLTGTTSEVLPVTTVDGRPIGNGRPGPVTRRLAETYRQVVDEMLAGPAS